MANINNVSELAANFTEGKFSVDSRFREGHAKYNLRFNDITNVRTHINELSDPERVFSFICEASASYPGLFAEVLDTIKKLLEAVQGVRKVDRPSVIMSEIFQNKPLHIYLNKKGNAKELALGTIVLLLFDPASDANLSNPHYIERVLYDFSEDQILNSVKDLVLTNDQYEGGISISNPYQAHLYTALFLTKLSGYLRDSVRSKVYSRGDTNGNVTKEIAKILPDLFARVLRSLLHKNGNM